MIQFNQRFTPRYGVSEKVAPGIRRVLAHNPGPFTFYGTSTYLVGHDEVAVIDPGPLIPEHVDNIVRALEPNETISHILITHTHADHSPAATLLQHQTGAPTFAFGSHPSTASASDTLEAGVDRHFVPDFCLRDGEHLQGPDWEIEAVHTPGHCSNHLCFAYKNQNILFCGDHLMAWSTTVILPPDGNIKHYLASLEKVQQRPERVYWPTHGPPITNPFELAGQVIGHRLARIQQIRSSVEAGCQDIASLRTAHYPDIRPELYRAAEFSILGALEYLIEEGHITRHGTTSRSATFSPVP